MADKSLLTCYRHGCGEQYNPEDNKDGKNFVSKFFS